jgi:hypothetical protein
MTVYQHDTSDKPLVAIYATGDDLLPRIIGMVIPSEAEHIARLLNQDEQRMGDDELVARIATGLRGIADNTLEDHDE